MPDYLKYIMGTVSGLAFGALLGLAIGTVALHAEPLPASAVQIKAPA